MLEHFNDYISLIVLLAIVLAFLYAGIKITLNSIERNRIRKDLEKREKRK